MRMSPAVKAILIINVVFYVLTYWITPMFPLGEKWFERATALYPIGNENFVVYQYITYMFVHGGWWHLFFNMWSLMIFGNAVEHQVGTKRFVYYYLLCGIGGGVVNQICSSASVVGASGATYGVVAAAAFFFPNTKLFIIPIPFPIKLKYFAIFYTLVEMYLGITSQDGIAHCAHLGGILVGVIILLIWRMQEKRGTQRSRGNDYATNSHYDKEEGAWDKMKSAVFGSRKPKMRVTNVRETNYADHVYNERKREESDEIDRILDKIRKNGYQNLSDHEKATLFNASKKMRGEE